MTHSPTRRPGFTLVELLVVVSIILALTALVLLFGPRLNDDAKVSRASDRLQGWLLVAKQRAVRDRAPRGLRLIYDTTKPPPSVTQLQYVEQPDPITSTYGGTLTVPPWTPYAAPPNNVNYRFNVVLQNILPTVQAGDLLEIIEPPGLYNILSTASPPTIPPTVLPTSPTSMQLTLGSVVPSYVPGTTAFATTNYRISRRPQPLVGEAQLSMPKDTLIDPALSRLGSSPANPANVVGMDIMFSPNGQPYVILYNAAGQVVFNGQPGNIILWVRDSLGTGKNQLLVIYQRSGLIGAHPPDLTNPNPYWMTQDGQSSGL
jgi:prepilin-type N-terminal cleavage/methylation domain-containing protein